MATSIGFLRSALVLSALIFSPVSQASVVTYDFTARITTLTEKDLGSGQFVNVQSSTFSGTPISYGQTISGSFFYSTTTPLGSYQPNPQAQGSYQLYKGPGKQNGISYTINESGLQFRSDEDSFFNLVQVADGASGLNGSDLFYLNAEHFSSDFLSGAIITLLDSSGSAFSDSSIPSTLDFSDFSYSHFQGSWYRSVDGGYFNFDASIESLTPHASAVPEPSSYLLFIAGLIMLTLFMRRKSA